MLRNNKYTYLQETAAKTHWTKNKINFQPFQSCKSFNGLFIKEQRKRVDTIRSCIFSKYRRNSFYRD